MNDLPIVDAHLDLAENVTLFGRDLTIAAHARRAAEQGMTGRATVSLPDLERGGVAVVCATVTAGFLAADVGEESNRARRSTARPKSRSSGDDADRAL